MFRPRLEEQEQVDPAETLMREVGVQLRRVRLERGEDLDHVAENLRIRPAYLDGIERGDLSIMPGRAYALGFLRSYAEYLGFDGDDLSRQIRSTVENLTDRTRLHIRTPLPESRVPKTSLVIFSLALLGGIYAGWTYLNTHRQLDADTVAEVPDRFGPLTVGSLPASTPAREAEDGVAASATGGDRTPATLPAPLGQPIETFDPGDPQSVDAAGPPDVDPGIRAGLDDASVQADVGDAGVRAGVGGEAPSGDQATLPPPVRQPRPTGLAAAEAPGTEPSGVDLPGAGSGATGASVERAEPVTATRALDSIMEGEIEGERPRAAEVAEGGRSLPDAPVGRSDRNAEGGPASTDEAAAVPEAGAAGRRQAAGAVALRSGGAQVRSPADADARADDRSSGAQSLSEREAAGPDADRAAAPGTVEELLAAVGPALLDPTASGAERAPRVYEREIADARVVIRARERSWIQIASASGDYVRSHTLEEGDVFLVPNRSDLVLWTGNAGGLEVTVDGRTLPPLGSDGSVQRDIPLDPESLLASFPG